VLLSALAIDMARWPATVYDRAVTRRRIERIKTDEVFGTHKERELMIAANNGYLLAFDNPVGLLRRTAALYRRRGHVGASEVPAYSRQPPSWSCRPLITSRLSWVSRPYFLARPLNCFQLPSIRFQSMTHSVCPLDNGAFAKEFSCVVLIGRPAR
jgi:hypothetical protein